jgi:mitofilin
MDEITQINKQWGIEVQERVDEERDGRLARLDVLANSLETLATAVDSVGEGYREGERRRAMSVGVYGLENAIENGGDVSGWVKRIRDLSGENESIVSVLNGLGANTKKQDIITRFARVEHELWKTQFLVDTVGPFSFAASWFASNFVTWCSWDNDIPGILARARVCLERGDVEGAAREVNQVPGRVGRGICGEWVREARGFSEGRQGVEVLRVWIEARDLGLI